jgi:hypothetical protein
MVAVTTLMRQRGEKRKKERKKKIKNTTNRIQVSASSIRLTQIGADTDRLSYWIKICVGNLSPEDYLSDVCLA